MAAGFSELRKLDNPPSAINWTRLNDIDPAGTAKRIVNFALRPPKWSYRPASSAIHDRIALGLDRETAQKMATVSGNPIGRPHNLSLVDAFYDYDAERGYTGRRLYGEGLTEYFKLSQDLWVPVKPLVVIAQNGRLIPIFLCGWSDLNLTFFQRQLFMTVVEDAFFTLTDFQEAQGEFLFFPQQGKGEIRRRAPEIWRRGEYPLLSPTQLQAQVQIYLEAREIARPIVEWELQRRAASEAGAAKGESSEDDKHERPWDLFSGRP